MIDTLLQILYIAIAVAMVVMILLQRGAGASGTVFGARGSANFLTKSTKWLAFVFFGLSLFMAWKAVNINRPAAAEADIGVMADLPAVPESAPAVPAATVPAAPAVPATAAPAASDAAPASAGEKK